MAQRAPLVLVDGELQELPVGDTIYGAAAKGVTRLQLETLAENLELVTGQVYSITDEGGRLAVAINTAVFSEFVIKGEIPEGDDPTKPQYISDDFYAGSGESGEGGSLNWSLTNGTISNVNNEANHPGMILLRTSATANQICSLHLGANTASTLIRFDEWDRMRWIFAPVTNSADCIYQVGMMSAFGALAPAHGVWLEKLAADANWFFVCAKNSAQTRLNTGVAFGTAWVNIESRRIVAGQVGFKINGGAELVINSNVPDASDSFNIGFQRTPTAAVTREVKLDWFSMKTNALVR